MTERSGLKHGFLTSHGVLLGKHNQVQWRQQEEIIHHVAQIEVHNLNPLNHTPEVFAEKLEEC